MVYVVPYRKMNGKNLVKLNNKFEKMSKNAIKIPFQTLGKDLY